MHTHTYGIFNLHQTGVSVEVSEPVQDPAGGVTQEGPGHHTLLLHQEAGILQHQLSDGQPHCLHPNHIHLYNQQVNLVSEVFVSVKVKYSGSIFLKECSKPKQIKSVLTSPDIIPRRLLPHFEYLTNSNIFWNCCENLQVCKGSQSIPCF